MASLAAPIACDNGISFVLHFMDILGWFFRVLDFLVFMLVRFREALVGTAWVATSSRLLRRPGDRCGLLPLSALWVRVLPC